jgi:hypothetical protein
LKAADNDPNRLVDAAIDLAAALKAYEDAEKWDQATQVRASLFWVKKRMNTDQLDKWLSRSGLPIAQRTAARKAMATVEEVATAPVEQSKAGEWLERAKAFADANPDKPFEVAIRYYEVAERFAGTDVAILAQRRSLDAQRKHMATVNKAASQAKSNHRDTLFTKPIRTGKGDQPVPDKRTLRSAQKKIKELYKEQYRNRDSTARFRFAQELMDTAQKTRSDAALRYGLLLEAIDVSQDVAALHLIWDACDRLAADFKDQDLVALKKTHLGRTRGSRASKAMTALFDDPFNAGHNLEAGKYFTFIAGRLDEGIALLLMSGDGPWSRAAAMEDAKPTKPAERFQLAQAWDALLEETRDEDMNLAMRRHILGHYERAVGGLSGIDKDTAQKRIDTIKKTVPLDDIADYGKISAEEFDRIPGMLFVVDAFRNNAPKVTVAPGQQIRVVPHPEDTWVLVRSSEQHTCGWQGATIKGRYEPLMYGDFKPGAMYDASLTAPTAMTPLQVIMC